MKLTTTKRYSPKGYVAINRPSAKRAYEAGIAITVAGNNVNSFHIFGGWHLGYTFQNTDIESREDGWTFDKLVENWQFHLEPELGSYPVFYVKHEALTALSDVGMGDEQ